MSIRCSLLGHDYGDTETEREREEQGSEVVVTVREFEECQRCGERKIVSENKEVTSLESPAPDLESVEADPTVDAGPAASTGSASPTGTDANAGANTDASAGTSTGTGTGTGAMGVPDEAMPAGGDDAEILGESSDADRAGPDDASAGSSAGDGSAGGSAGSASTGGSAGHVEPEGDATAVENDFEESAADDDAEILDADAAGDGEDDERTPGEWPEAETTHPAEADERGATDWPNVERDDEGFDAEPDDGGRTDVEFGGGLTPESASDVTVDDETDEVEFVNASGDTLGAGDAGRDAGRDVELSSGIAAGAEAPSVSGPSDDPDLDAEFVCPECDYREEVSGSSLRAGDICPECGRGYLAQE